MIRAHSSRNQEPISGGHGGRAWWHTGLGERGGGEAGAGGTAVDRAAGAVDASTAFREGAGAGRVTSGAKVAKPLGGTCTIGWAVYLLPGSGDSEASGLKASMASATLPYREAGVFCMRRSTTATNWSGVSGLTSLIGGGCFV